MENRLVVGMIAAVVVAAVVTAVALAEALPANDGDGLPQGDPAAFVIRVVDHVVSDDYASVWPSLYPRHQQVAPLDEYVSCELLTPVGWKLRAAHAVRVVQRLRRIPGEDEARPVTLVTLRLVIENPALHSAGGFTHTFTTVADGSRWTWILTPARYRLYRDDACGDSSAGLPVVPATVPTIASGPATAA